MTASIYLKTIERLIEAKIPSPRLEARILIGHILHISPDEITSNTRLKDDEEAMLDKLIAQKIAHEPTDKIIGKKDFYKYTFITDKNVLSPRDDTETLIEAAIKIADKTKTLKILDLGTGSGCILCTLLKELDNAVGVGVDKSAKALETATKNAENLGINDRCQWLSADWFDKDFTDNFNHKFDLIVTNPPYIPTDDIKNLAPEVKNYDPLLALDGGKDGLNSYRKIALFTPKLLTDNGYILIEAGINQALAVKQIFQNRNMIFETIKNDLNGIPRCIIFSKKDCN